MMYCAVRKTEIASETTVGNPPMRVLYVRALKNIFITYEKTKNALL